MGTFKRRRTARAVVCVCALILLSFFLARDGMGPVEKPASEQSIAQAEHGGPDGAATAPALTAPATIAISEERTSVSALKKITRQDFEKARILDEIIVASSDNDPRLDRELRQLSWGAKTLFQQRYRSLPGESLNQRGTVVFLLGRNLTSEKDLEFLGSVLEESPCLSLADCKSSPEMTASAQDLHHEAGNEITLAYPQVVALKALESYLRRADRKPDLAAQALHQLEQARQSTIPTVSRLANEISRRLADNG